MFTEESSSDEDFDGILKKAIDVQLPKNFDPKSVPQSGEEYLHHVIYERSKCKRWVTAEIDHTKYLSNQTFSILKENCMKKAPEKLQPSKDWQQKKLNEFAEFTKFIETKLDADPNTTSFETENFIDKINNNPPLFSEITTYSQATKLIMLQKITRHLSTLEVEEGVSENLGAWIFALLTLLEKPLSPDTCYNLREFAKKCAVFRASLSDSADKKMYAPLNLFICIVAKYFNQLDLCD